RAARGGAVKPQMASRRAIRSLLREDLALDEAVIARAVQLLQRRQASGAFLELEWRSLTSNTKIVEESMQESRAALKMVDELPVVASGKGGGELRVRTVAERYLEAAGLLFDRSELVGFVAALPDD